MTQPKLPSDPPHKASAHTRRVNFGPRPRWTEIIRRHRNKWQTIWNLIKVFVLIYAFLAAINMMGKGIKVMGTRPEYVKPAETATALITPKAEWPRITVTPAEAGGQDLLGKKFWALGRFGAAGMDAGGQEAGAGLVAIGDMAVPAVTTGDVVKTEDCVRVVEVAEDRLVVEHIPKYKQWVLDMFHMADNPFLALLVGILITSTFQSSSFTTSMTIGFVAGIGFPLENAIPVIMGANIGTSVTNLLVAMGYVRRREEFRRAFAAATVHDMFNVLTVGLLFLIEVTTHSFSRLAEHLAGLVYRGHGTVSGPPTNPLKDAVSWVIDPFHGFLENTLGLSENPTGIIMTVLAVGILFFALMFLVKTLRAMVLTHVESFFDRVLFRNAATAFVVGLLLTVTVQSSSVTTSLIVPLTAAGLLTLPQIFPYCVGANIGTTFTGLLAAFAVNAPTQHEAKAALTLACAHLLFNVIGAIIFMPLKSIPIAMARGLADRCAESRRYAVIFVVGLFFVLPIAGMGLYTLLSGD